MRSSEYQHLMIGAVESEVEDRQQLVRDAIESKISHRNGMLDSRMANIDVLRVLAR